MKFVGIDYSMTSPGICIIDENDQIEKLYYFTQKPKLEGKQSDVVEGIPYPIYGNDIERFHKLATITVELIKKANDKVEIGIEGYSFGSSGSRVFQIAENCGILKHLLLLQGHQFQVVPPTVVKKLATGKGNSSKEPVYNAFVEQTGIKLNELLGIKSEKVGSPMSDMADAYWIAKWVKQNVDIHGFTK